MANNEQIRHWNSEESRHWVAHQERYDAMLAPFVDRLLEVARLSGTDRVLDVGCGCGVTTLTAGSVVPSGSAVGVDISAPMLEVASRRATKATLSNVSFVEGDAQTHPFSAGEFDVVISRFGVMFFDDPESAFNNLAASMAPGGRMAFVCWQDMAKNPFVLVPGIALAEHVPLPDLGPAGAPGMFALADPARIQSILTDAGLEEVSIDSLIEEILLGGGGSLDDAVQFLRYGGMGRAVLDGVDEATQDQVKVAVSEALAPFLTSEGVRIGCAAWLVSAVRP